MECIFSESAVALYLYPKIHAVLVEVVDDDGLHPCRGSSGVTGRRETTLVPFWSVVPLGIVPNSGFRASDLLSTQLSRPFPMRFGAY